MKLNELFLKSLPDVIKNLDLVDFKIYSDDSGNIKAVELKYSPKKTDNVLDDPFAFYGGV